MPEDETIHIALAFCDPKGTYARHAAVTMASIYANTKREVCVHVIHDDTMTGENRDKLEALTLSYKQRIDFVNVENMFDGKKLNIDKLSGVLTKGSLFRLLLPDIIEVDKIIYLDCDVIVNMDITELWNVPIGNSSVAAVRDVWSLDFIKGTPVPWRLGMLWDILGINHDGYFNSGVLLLNLKKLREEYDFLRAVENFYMKYQKCITMADQDCLNCIFANDKLLMEEKFNRIDTEGIVEEDLQDSIWHMTSAKPWVTCTRPYVDDLYWRYLRLTPYCEDDNKLIRLMLNDLSSPSYTHLHSSDCVKRLKKQIADNIFRAHIWTVPHILMKKIGGSK